MNDVLFAAKDLGVEFGVVRALDGVDLRVGRGQLVGLIGPNGAGKTTFIDAVTGFVRSTGSVVFAGQDISTLSPHGRCRVGLARTWQSLEVFEDLTVEENVQVAMERPTLRSFCRDALWPRRDVDGPRLRTVLDAVGLAARADAMPDDLSHGERKLLVVARALAGSPQLLLLDEPAAGLDSHASLVLGEHLRNLVDRGTTMLLVDHDMGLVLSVCDYIYVLDFGRVLAEGTPADVRANPDVVEAYLGTSAGSSRSRGDT